MIPPDWDGTLFRGRMLPFTLDEAAILYAVVKNQFETLEGVLPMIQDKAVIEGANPKIQLMDFSPLIAIREKIKIYLIDEMGEDHFQAMEAFHDRAAEGDLSIFDEPIEGDNNENESGN